MLGLLLVSRMVHATPSDLTGFGASTGRAAGGLALDGGGEALLLNPASAVRSGFQVGAGLYRFAVPETGGLRWDTNQDGTVDSRDEPLAWDVEPDPGEVVVVGALERVSERLAVGIAASVPSRRLVRVTAHDASLPVYPLYDNQLQRVELALGASFVLTPALVVGAAVEVVPRGQVDLALTVDAGASNVLGEGLPSLEDELVVDVHDVTLDLRAGYVPLAGVTLDLSEAVSGLELGLSYREQGGVPVGIDVELQGDLAILDAGDDVTLAVSAPLRFLLQDHFVPRSVRLGGAMRDRWGSPFLEAWWLQWSALDVAVARLTSGAVESPALDLTGIEVTDDNARAGTFRDVVELHGGFDDLGGEIWSGRAGAVFQPRVVDDAAGTLLDALRLGLASALSRQTAFGAVELQGQAHVLLPRAVPAIQSGEGSLVEGSDHPVGGALWFVGVLWRWDDP